MKSTAPTISPHSKAIRSRAELIEFCSREYKEKTMPKFSVLTESRVDAQSGKLVGWWDDAQGAGAIYSDAFAIQEAAETLPTPPEAKKPDESVDPDTGTPVLPDTGVTEKPKVAAPGKTVPDGDLQECINGLGEGRADRTLLEALQANPGE